MTAEPGKIVGGKYRLEKPLAKGGMGSVWLATHTELDAPVAVKFMAHELVGTPVAEMRFKREARAAAQLRSPHVVHIHDYGVEDRVPYMVMELLEGRDLAAELVREGKLGIGRVATIVAQVAKALVMAHAAGIVHRDLKPSNLFLARSGEDEIVKVLDFGVAKETMPTLVVDKTTSGTLVGSPQYMSPEQARGEHVDFRSDLWSLGVVVFEALTGRPPFESTHLGALLAKIHEANAPAPTSLSPELPRAIDGFAARALARWPDDRFPSARAMADELAEIAANAGDAAPARQSTITVVPARSVVVVGRAEDTLPAKEPPAMEPPEGEAAADDDLPAEDLPSEPAPVSTTMDERGSRPRVDGGGRPRALVRGLAAAAAVGAIGIGIGWFGFGPGQSDGAGEQGTGSTEPGTTSARDAAAEARPEVTAPAATTTAVAVEPAASGPADAADAPRTAPPQGAPATTGVAATKAAASSAPRPKGSSAPVQPPVATAPAAATSAPTAAPAPTTTAAPTSTQPARDPTFGL